jgi:hypothetical protein
LIVFDAVVVVVVVVVVVYLLPSSLWSNYVGQSDDNLSILSSFATNKGGTKRKRFIFSNECKKSENEEKESKQQQQHLSG